MIVKELLLHIPLLMGLLFLLGCSAFFSGSETALFSLTRADIRRLEGASDRRSGYLLFLLRSPQLLLSGLLLGNMVVNVAFFAGSFFITLDLARNVSRGAAAVSGAVSLFAVILFGEVTPKGIAVGCPERFSRLVAPALYLYCRATLPASTALGVIARRVTGFLSSRLPREPYVTREELQMLARMAERHGVMDRDTVGMVQQVMALGMIRVKEVMTPRVDVPMFDIAEGREAFCERVRKTREDRVLVYEGSVDNVLGLVVVRDVYIHSSAGLRELLRPLRFVPETQTVESLLRQFRNERHAVALVVDEYGGTAGLVDQEQILEEVVGQIRDEWEPVERPVEQLDEDAYLVAGDLSMRAWEELLGGGHDLPGVETLGGLVTALLGRIPARGDAVSWRGLWLTVERMEGPRVMLVRVERIREGDEAR